MSTDLKDALIKQMLNWFYIEIFAHLISPPNSCVWWITEFGDEYRDNFGDVLFLQKMTAKFVKKKNHQT